MMTKMFAIFSYFKRLVYFIVEMVTKIMQYNSMLQIYFKKI